MESIRVFAKGAGLRAAFVLPTLEPGWDRDSATEVPITDAAANAVIGISGAISIIFSPSGRPFPDLTLLIALQDYALCTERQGT